REFEQMEMQYFVQPGTDMEWFEKWKEIRVQWHLNNGIRKNKIRFHEHCEKELDHYAKAAFDIEYEFTIGWQEIEGVHNRTDFDLKRHQQFSGKKLEYFDESTKDRFVPFIVETSAGCDRSLLTVLCDSYRKEGDRVWLKIHPELAPYKVAIFPLMKKPELLEYTDKVVSDVRKRFRMTTDDAGSIGKRYRRQDEIGTPNCIVIDFDTLEDDTVTVRDRDTTKQTRVKIENLIKYDE
ncbi:glycine--tRNA ligase, partial [Candidatus Saccharibacteria bacterium]|nr:glycine--tRNA ligase [Candidatus Saccharibacteria bacterium]